MKVKITAVILTRNEQEGIVRCLNSVAFCDEVIVIDDFSLDETSKRVKGVKIFQHKLNGDFAGQRNFGMEKAKHEWVLFVDGDETISDELKSEIELKIKNEKLKNDLAGFYIKRRDYFWDREMRYGETETARNRGILRLVRKNAGRWEGKVHEEFKISNLKFQIKNLTGYINHYPHQTVKEFIESVNFYSTLRAKALSEKGHQVNIMEIIFFPLGKFIYTYLLKLGFLDGAPGFVYSFMMSFHSFLVRAKLYQYSRINK